MPKDKTETHERIIPAAMKIFLEKGFEKATMRESCLSGSASCGSRRRRASPPPDCTATL